MTEYRQPAFSDPALDPGVMATQPVVVKRSCPGYLVLAGPASPIRFGVTGDTEAEALDRFGRAREEWARLRAMP